MNGLTRTQLAALAGCHAEAVRHYERMHLLPEPPRSAGGHRRYEERHLDRLRLILSGRNLGMTTDDLAALLSLLDGAAPPSARRRAATRRLAKLVTARLQDLDRLLALAERLNSGND